MRVYSPDVGTHICVGTIVKSRFASYVDYWFEGVDPVTGWFEGSVMPCGIYSLPETTGAYDNSYNNGDHWRIYDARAPLSPQFTSHRDAANYGNAFSRWQGLYDALSGIYDHSAVPGEHDVYHAKSVGDFTPSEFAADTWYEKVPTGSFYWNTFYFPASYWPVQASQPNKGRLTRVKRRDDGGYELIPDWETGLPFPALTIDDCVHGLQQKFYDGSLGGYSYYSNTRITAISVQRGIDSLRVEYEGFWEYDPDMARLHYNPLYRWDFHNEINVTYTVSMAPPEVFFDRDTERSISLSVPVEFRLNTTITACKRRYPGNIDPEVGHTVSVSLSNDDTQYLSYPADVSGRHYLPTLIREQPSASFSAYIDAAMPDVRPASFISTCSAFDKYTGYINSSLLESLSEIKEIGEIVPDLGFVLETARHSNVSLRTLSKLVKGGASEYLRLIFGTLPTISLLNEIPRIYDVIRRIGSLKRNASTAYGSFHYVFYDDFGRDQTDLIVRSKVVFTGYPSADLAALLDLSSLQVLPVPSNLWELVPMSFVVDWFLNITNRMRLIENMLLLACSDTAYFVHSYTFRSDITDSDTSRWTVTANTPVAYLKYYVREISRETPGPRSSKYDFMLPQRPPPLVTSISLAIATMF